MKLQRYQLNSKNIDIKFLRKANELWVHYNGRTILYSPAQNRAASLEPGGLGPVLAPMPGKIIKLFVENGKHVQVGDSLLVMEAMKMEYTIKASEEALVESLNLSIGDQVSDGEQLLKLVEVDG